MIKQWSKKFNKCVQCGTTETKHHANGLCHNCYYNTPKWKEYMKEYRKTLEYKKYRREYRATPERRAYQKEYRQRLVVKERMNEYRKKWHKEKAKIDPKFRLDQNMGSAIYHALNGVKAGRKWQKLVGYTLKDLINHLEKQFDENMSWDNYGSYWHIDHIIPKSWFIYKTPDDIGFKMAWGLNNLQPLEGVKNFKKSNKLTYNN